MSLLEGLQTSNLRLGDLIVSLRKMEMTYFDTFSMQTKNPPPHMTLLSTKIARETQAEINNFLIFLLQNITGEQELTWNLMDAIHMQLVTGSIKLYSF